MKEKPKLWQVVKALEEGEEFSVVDDGVFVSIKGTTAKIHTSKRDEDGHEIPITLDLINEMIADGIATHH